MIKVKVASVYMEAPGMQKAGKAKVANVCPGFVVGKRRRAGYKCMSEGYWYVQARTLQGTKAKAANVYPRAPDMSASQIAESTSQRNSCKCISASSWYPASQRPSQKANAKVANACPKARGMQKVARKLQMDVWRLLVCPSYSTASGQSKSCTCMSGGSQ